MKKFLLTLLALVLIVGVLAGVAFLGYRLGYKQGALTIAAPNGSTNIRPFMHGDDFAWRKMPMHNFGIDPHFGFHPGFGMMLPGRGFGFFSPILFVVQLAVLGFIIWLVYKLLTGWRLTLTRTTAESPRAEPVQPVKSETKDTEGQSN
jgi:hypothetical protein